jgi:hypothetical protein
VVIPKPISLKPSRFGVADLVLEFLAVLVVERILAICCAMLSTPRDIVEANLAEVALLDSRFELEMKSFIAIPESLQELAAGCGACDGSREGAGRAPDMKSEADR